MLSNRQPALPYTEGAAPVHTEFTVSRHVSAEKEDFASSLVRLDDTLAQVRVP